MKKILKVVREAISRRMNYTTRAAIGGGAFRAPIVGGIGRNLCADAEPWMESLIRHFLADGTGAVIDVGSNIGQTLLKVKAVDSDVSYIAFEPNPHCISYLHRLIAANRFSNVTLYPFGLFPEAKVLSLDLGCEGAWTDASASLVPDFRPGRPVYKKLKVPVFPFSVVAREEFVDGIALIKVDVEGGELEVFQALRDTLDEFAPPVVFEVLPAYSKDSERLARQKELKDLLTSLGYRILRVDKTAPFDVRNCEVIDEFPIHSDLAACDYIALPRKTADSRGGPGRQENDGG